MFNIVQHFANARCYFYAEKRCCNDCCNAHRQQNQHKRSCRICTARSRHSLCSRFCPITDFYYVGRRIDRRQNNMRHIGRKCRYKVQGTITAINATDEFLFYWNSSHSGRISTVHTY